MGKRALLIGINRYALPGGDLRGCVNDVHNIAGVLVNDFGFSEPDITMLLDEQATKGAMEDAIGGLVASGRPGDVLYLQYSGHGSNVIDTTSDEDDGRDEILCPHDLDWDDPLTDDWLRTTFDELDRGASLTVVMDCCHSGSNTRAPIPPDSPVIPRFLPNPHDRTTGGEFTGTSKRSMRGGSMNVHALDISETLLTGCRDKQTSADANIGGAFNGALTYYLVRALRALGPGATYLEVHDETVRRLMGNYDQVPQLEGREQRLARPFLSPQY